MVQVGAHSVTERAQQGKAVGEDIAARCHLVPNGEQQLLLPRTAIEVIRPGRLAHARIGEGAVAIKMPITFW